MTTLEHRERTALHVLAFLYFRMGMTEKAERIYTALAALPMAERNTDAPWEVGRKPATLDAQALLGLAALALERDAAATALEHVRSLLEHTRLGAGIRPASSVRLRAIESAAHLVSSQALRALGRPEEAAVAVQSYMNMQKAPRNGASDLEKRS